MSKRDPELEQHKAWLGLVQPVGLVVSPPALVKLGVVPEARPLAQQQRLIALAQPEPEAPARIRDFKAFAAELLGWEAEDLREQTPEVALPGYGDVLDASFALVDGFDDDEPTLLLVKVVPPGPGLDALPPERHAGWHASPQARFERLLRESGVHAGLLCDGDTLRLVYAPQGETSGHLSFPVAAMCEVAGRPILAAMLALLSEAHVTSAPQGASLRDLLAESRKYQAEVSTRLADQVLGALWELLRGVQAADAAAQGQVLRGLPREDPQAIYGGLLSVIMRLVFLLYAEDQGLMPDDPVYVRSYAVTALYERLREDAGRYPDTMDQRFGAWAWLLTLFRLIHDGGAHAGLSLPRRHGQLFNPDSYPFLEGRPQDSLRVMGEPVEAPRVPDGAIWRVLEGLLVLDGERLSYRSLDVEQIGSVYEAMMGFEVCQARGRSVGVRRRKQGMDLDIVVNVDLLLGQSPNKRTKWLEDQTEATLGQASGAALKAAQTPEDVVAALGRKRSPRTPQVLPPGALYLQPGEERRRSGSHYTPRELTEPIVRTTLRPIFEAMGDRPRPEQILDLKVCDPAMGSGAFLVEACRQLAAKLVESWELHDCVPALPGDVEPLTYARRLVAQRCLYGVDKNPFAVNLAKLSLWLVTMARDHAFTFLDHALKHGDSLVGLSLQQIGAFHWDLEERDWGPLFAGVTRSVTDAKNARALLDGLDEDDWFGRKSAHEDAEEALADTRLVGDLVIAAFFGAEKARAREARRQELRELVDGWRKGEVARAELEAVVEGLRSGERPVPPFHWALEFPEVFGRENPGFDAVVGNPPFLGGTKISTLHGTEYKDYIYQAFPSSGNRMDLVAYFFRQGFQLVKYSGCVGLFGTNTLQQGDTREGGLEQIIDRQGNIYSCNSRQAWPGQAAVVVCSVNIIKGPYSGVRTLNGNGVNKITAFLLHMGPNSTPKPLVSQSKNVTTGGKIYGQGFIFADNNPETTPISTMHALTNEKPSRSNIIFPYVCGSDINSAVDHLPDRFVINFGSSTLKEAQQWPALLRIVEEKVKPARRHAPKQVQKVPWWQYYNRRDSLQDLSSHMVRVLSRSLTSKHHALAFLPTRVFFDQTVVVFIYDQYSSFAILESKTHDLWARFLGATMKDDPRYNTKDCFETFPFPEDWQTHPTLEAIGQRYYDFRAALMVKNDEGLTATYNRFHDPDETDPEILELRRLHAEMDRAVLDAYGWTDIPTDCVFLLDYEIDEDNWSPRKKKPWRYRWPEEVHDEVLARLLELNQRRAEEERLAGEAAAAAGRKGRKTVAARKGGSPRKPKGQGGGSLNLFDSKES